MPTATPPPTPQHADGSAVYRREEESVLKRKGGGGQRDRPRRVSSTRSLVSLFESKTAAAAASSSSSSSSSLLDRTLCALFDVAFRAKIDEGVLAREKDAVLSEISMLSTADYRLRIDQLSDLHKETMLPSRIPLGTVESIRNLSAERVREFYTQFYQPNRAHVYIVGDIDVLSTKKSLERSMSSTVPSSSSSPFPIPSFSSPSSYASSSSSSSSASGSSSSSSGGGGGGGGLVVR
mmetsp:Transcript_3028/g.4763  ORF Transcript_3028/g.4763 Transcript_3028/m.4763 type:complete len:236 (-) Transcript_3028:358-1065(-)